jgi:hypothetical protein
MATDPGDNNNNPYRAPQASDTGGVVAPKETGKHQSDKRRIMVWMLTLFALEPVLEYATGAGLGRLFTVMFSLTFGAQCVRWCYYDQLERDASLWRYFAATMILCPGPLLVFPIYFLYTRGLQRGLVATLAAFAYLVVLLTVHLGMFYLLGLEMV